MTTKKTASRGRKRTVGEVYRQMSSEDEVVIDQYCSQVILKPKEKEIINKELNVCRLKLPRANPIEERAKQKLYKALYKDKSTKMRYIEQVGPTREEVESGVESVDNLPLSPSNSNNNAVQLAPPNTIAES